MGAMAILGVKWGLMRRQKESNKANLARVKGDPQASLQIIEFIDFQCPACANGAMFLKKVIGENPGIISLQMKYFPLSMHRHANSAAVYAECAARQEKFWPFQDIILERQQQWTNLNDEEVKNFFNQTAKEVEIKEREFQSCLKDDAVKEIILAEKEEGSKLGVQSTPTYFINGQIFVGPRALSAELEKYIKPQP